MPEPNRHNVEKVKGNLTHTVLSLKEVLNEGFEKCVILTLDISPLPVQRAVPTGHIEKACTVVILKWARSDLLPPYKAFSQLQIFIMAKCLHRLHQLEYLAVLKNGMCCQPYMRSG